MLNLFVLLLFLIKLGIINAADCSCWGPSWSQKTGSFKQHTTTFSLGGGRPVCIAYTDYHQGGDKWISSVLPPCDVSSDSAKVTALESTSATQTAKVTAVEETTSALETTSAAEQAKVVTLESKTSALESISTSEASKVSTLEASSSTVTGKVSTLESKVAAEEAKIVTLESKTAALESTSTSEATKLATAEGTITSEAAKGKSCFFFFEII